MLSPRVDNDTVNKSITENKPDEIYKSQDDKLKQSLHTNTSVNDPINNNTINKNNQERSIKFSDKNTNDNAISQQLDNENSRKEDLEFSTHTIKKQPNIY